jgi:hypothetical protein
MVAQLDSTFLRAAPGRTASRLVGYFLFEGRPVTTTGRWWNPVVFRHLHFAASRAGMQVDRPVFIVGMGRSGTTLLGRILAAHPSVGFLNEPKAMWHLIRDDEDIIGSYAEPRTGRLYLSARDVDEEVTARGRALFAWYLRASRSGRVVDKYPELIFRHAFVRAIFPDARFLIAVRSPWATLKSVTGWSNSNATGSADWWGVRDQKWDILWSQGVAQNPANSDLAALDLANETSHHTRAAIEWVVTMREAISLASIDPCSYIVRYEELGRHPRDVVRDTLRFCELPASSRTEAYACATVSAHESANGERHTCSSLLPKMLTDAIDQTWARLDATGRARPAGTD